MTTVTGPVVVTGITADHLIAKEKVVGPPPSVIGFETEDEVVNTADGIEYGLPVWTDEVGGAQRAATAVPAGYFWINGPSRH